MSLTLARHPCDRCFKVFPTLADVFAHCRTCKANPNLSCRDCSATFSRIDALKRHQVTCKAGYTISCKHKWCNSKFETQEAMEFHAHHCVQPPCHGKSTSPLAFTCGKPWCTKTFKTKSNRKLHEKACKSPADVAASMVRSTCTKCHKTFSTEAYAEQHQSRCKGLKTDVSRTCNKCHKTFSTAAYAEQHQSQCQGPTTNVSRTCSKCSMQFSSACYMQQHTLTCGITYKCSRQCGQSFSRPFKRARHEETCSYVAPPQRKYWCPVCPRKGFVTRKQYDAHAQAGVHVPPMYLESPKEPLPPADRPLILDHALVAREMCARNMPVPECLQKYLQ